MKNNIYLILFLNLLFFTNCQKKQDNYTPILLDRAYTIEKLTCDANNRFFDWKCSFNENYIQKDITFPREKNCIFSFQSDNFNTSGYGFRVIVFVDGIIRYRTTTRTFPFETPLKIPAGSVVSVKTYFEQYASANGEISGNVNCRVSTE